MKKILSVLLALSFVLCLAACGQETQEPSDANSAETQTDAEPDAPLTKLTFALDWTQNTNHTGLYVAKEKGWFKEAGLDVDIVYVDGDSSTQLVAAGHAQFGIEFQDTLAAAYTADEPLPITAIAAVLQHNTSGIISRRGDGITSAAGLAGKRYSTWDSPIEKAMLKQMVEKDGKNWDDVELIPNTVTDEAAALSANQTDAIRIFWAWSGVNAELSGFDYDFFYIKNENPYFDYYTPVIIGNDTFMQENPDVTKAFIKAVQKGYTFAAENPKEAADILIASDDTNALKDASELVYASQEWIAKEYVSDAPYWGYIDDSRWNAFYGWLNSTGLLEKELPDGTGFTNEYLQ
ncbi:MAG: ABC transporter substrate-binding protein [Clostridia bacterium]|nr:ABC transporter substrate-binding protein [Clostridia bacterium]